MPCMFPDLVDFTTLPRNDGNQAIGHALPRSFPSYSDIARGIRTEVAHFEEILNRSANDFPKSGDLATRWGEVAWNRRQVFGVSLREKYRKAYVNRLQGHERRFLRG